MELVIGEGQVCFYQLVACGEGEERPLSTAQHPPYYAEIDTSMSYI